MSDFDRIFDAQYAAAELFTNRTAEHESFRRSAFYHRERIRDGTATLANVARHHVLTFYGIGGIGKTELSRRLERWILGELPKAGEWGPGPSFDHPVRTVRFDFHGSASVNAGELVIRLRAALADTARRFPAFDLGLTAWWASAYPGTALPDLRSAAGFDVRGQINDTINEILSEAGARYGVGPLTVRSGSMLVDAIRTRLISSKALRDCEPLNAVIEQIRFDPSPYVAASLAGLLSWDAERLPDEHKPLIVIFADAVEYIQGGNRSQERLFNRIVHLTPGFLWVVTSRRSLDWDSPSLAGLLPAVGPAIWPGLGIGVQTEPRQHLVGDLSDADVERFLAAASDSAGNPPLSAEIRDRIRRGAHGLPLYLDLSLAIARAAVDPLDPQAFGGPLPQLVTRVFTDLPEAEYEIARTASLLTRFDPDTLAQASGAALGASLRFCQRSLVEYDGHPMFPYRLHDAVRAAVGEEPPDAPGAWAPVDWRARAAALAEVLRARHDNSLDSIEQRLEILELVAHLCAENDLETPWLLNALVDLPGIAQTAARLPPPSTTTWIGQVSRFFHAWPGRNARERIAYLTEFLTDPIPDDLRSMARRWLAYSHGSRGEYEKALEIFQRLFAEDPDSDLVQYHLGRTLHHLGRYAELQAHMETYPTRAGAADLRLASDLAFDRAEFPDAFAGPAARASYLRSIGRHRVALENRAAALWRRAVCGQATVAECDAHIDEADRYGMRTSFRTGAAAKMLCLSANDPRVTESIAEVDAIIKASRAARGWREYAAGLIHALRRGDAARVAEIRAEWVASGRSWSPNYQLVDRICVYAGHPPVYQAPQFRTEAETAAVDRRWHTLIDALVRQ